MSYVLNSYLLTYLLTKYYKPTRSPFIYNQFIAAYSSGVASTELA